MRKMPRPLLLLPELVEEQELEPELGESSGLSDSSDLFVLSNCTSTLIRLLKVPSLDQQTKIKELNQGKPSNFRKWMLHRKKK
jgi:hypothetical protein